jgi:hypothetical protein
VHDTLWDTLSVKVGEEVYQVEVLEEEGTILSDALSLVRVGHGHTVGGGIGELGGLLILVVVVDLCGVGISALASLISRSQASHRSSTHLVV